MSTLIPALNSSPGQYLQVFAQFWLIKPIILAHLVFHRWHLHRKRKKISNCKLTVLFHSFKPGIFIGANPFDSKFLFTELTGFPAMTAHELSVFLTATVQRVDAAEISVIVATGLRVTALVQLPKLFQISCAEPPPLPNSRVLPVGNDRCSTIPVNNLCDSCHPS